MVAVFLWLLAFCLRTVTATTCQDWDENTLRASADYHLKTIKDKEMANPLSSSLSRSGLMCAAACVKDPDCFSVNYRQETKECKKLAEDWYRATPKLVDSIGWDFVYLVDKGAPLGMIDKTIPNSAITGDIWPDTNTAPYKARLDAQSSWQPGLGYNMHIDLGTETQLVRITTQGCECVYKKWVVKYILAFSLDNITWTESMKTNQTC
ncbi:PREDICTED: uncharacterized protein LOC106805822 [Priapulus caudatus]|uniref:Uncharacterized protein LOC106805822 n=1 Tax=Priapulus caudatus TaxID=37621 RepID=A0ABM1DSY3_PRICU|nr:PREDICTED: uncharacterized protein LOC106805822 [Priapulus caudatus]